MKVFGIFATMTMTVEADKVSEQATVVAKVDLEAESGDCGDGVHVCSGATPICCFEGHSLHGCCDIAHPVCDNVNNKCLSSFEAAMLESTGPTKQDEPVDKVDLDAESGACGDGVHECSDPNTPICCFEGHSLHGCCDIAHPVCDNVNNKCLSSFEAAMLDSTGPTKQDKPVEKVDLEAESGACGDGVHYCSDPNTPICCFNGHYLQGCCDIAHPVCDNAHNQCLSSFEAAMLGSTRPTEQEKAVEKVDLEAESGDCGDGVHHCSGSTPICCFEGHSLHGCCDIAHPVCDNANNKCLSSFEAAMLASTPTKQEKPVEEVDLEAEAEGPCGDGVHQCSGDTPICCFNGHYLQGCCDIAHPVCDNADNLCKSAFEVAMTASAGPTTQDAPVEKVELEAEVEDHCGDGVHVCTDAKPICCFNGHYLQGCCDIAHPVCDNADNLCKSQFEAAMTGSSGSTQQEKPDGTNVMV